jgi:hypothetical protein
MSLCPASNCSMRFLTLAAMMSFGPPWLRLFAVLGGWMGGGWGDGVQHRPREWRLHPIVLGQPWSDHR